EAIGEDAIEHPYFVTESEPGPLSQRDKALPILACAESFDDVVGYGHRIVAIAHKTCNANGGVDRAPALAHHVDGHEKVAREQRSGDSLNSPCVTPTLEEARQIRCEALARQVREGFCFSMPMGLNDVPA